MKNSIKTLLLIVAAVLFAVLPSACSDSNGGNGDNTTPAVSDSADVTSQKKETPVDTDDSAETQAEEEPGSELWKDAKYTEDTEVGEGAVTVKVKVVAGDKSITLTVHTDRNMLGAALIDNELVSGDESEYGLYIKFVNGIEADYDKNQAYWSISKDGEYLMTGVDTTPIADGENYELTYTKG